jgi:hypothetical protein
MKTVPYTHIGFWMIFVIPLGLAAGGLLYLTYGIMGPWNFLCLLALLLWFIIGFWCLMKGEYFG